MESQIDAVDAKIAVVETEVQTAEAAGDKKRAAQLRTKEKDLRQDKKDLRKKEADLRKKEADLRKMRLLELQVLVSGQQGASACEGCTAADGASCLSCCALRLTSPVPVCMQRHKLLHRSTTHGQASRRA